MQRGQWGIAMDTPIFQLSIREISLASQTPRFPQHRSLPVCGTRGKEGLDT